MSRLLAALLLGMAGGMGQDFSTKLHGPGGSFGGSRPHRFRTAAGHHMQEFRRKKPRNIKGRSR